MIRHFCAVKNLFRHFNIREAYRKFGPLQFSFYIILIFVYLLVRLPLRLTTRIAKNISAYYKGLVNKNLPYLENIYYIAEHETINLWLTSTRIESKEDDDKEEKEIDENLDKNDKKMIIV